MAELKVVRWRKFGKDRLYVDTVEGVRVGWVDLLTGDHVLEVHEHRLAFEEALRHHGVERRSNNEADHPQADNREAETAAGVESLSGPKVESSAPPPAAAARPWSDLSWNRPGEAVREQALARQHESPIRTWINRRRKDSDERAWRIGAQGETMVAEQLAKLPRTWRFLHAVPVGRRGSDIDHVAIGPGGVYTINAKHHPDAKVDARGNIVFVNGAKTWYVRNARSEAERAARCLGEATGIAVPVTGLIVIVGARGGFTVKRQPPCGSVYVLARRALAEWLGRRGESLAEAQITALFDAGRRSTVWT